MKKLTVQEVAKMSYVQLLASIDEVNRPPGGKESIRRVVQNTFLTKDSNVLDVGCNTGYSTFEIAHLVKCKVTGVDISPEMIKTAQRFKAKDTYRKQIEFQVADGMNLPFADKSFDVTMSGGSTAFIADKVRALQEYARVTKTWGFVADVNFFYKKKPSSRLIKLLNDSMKINIQPWDKSYWLNIYEQTDLELYYTYYDDVYVPTKKEVVAYCERMSSEVPSEETARLLIKDRLIEIMMLFAENHRYLAYGVFVLRKRDKPEQVSLFGA